METLELLALAVLATLILTGLGYLLRWWLEAVYSRLNTSHPPNKRPPV